VTLSSRPSHPLFFPLQFKEYLETCPHDVVPYLDPVFQCGLGGLTFNHREAIEAVITFFDRLFGKGFVLALSLANF